MSQKLKEYIQNGWARARTTGGERDLPLPHPYVPPTAGGLFTSLFYWDTYFTNIGMTLDGRLEWAKDNVEDLLFALRHFGCVPNYTRKDGADYCSQPPLLSLMVGYIYEQTKDEVWLADAVAALETEYEFWMRERMTPIGLNQYSTNAKSENLLVDYYEYITTRIYLPMDVSTEEKMRVARNFISEAESGQDYNPRFGDHHSLDFAHIDLNCHLYGLEDFLYEYFTGKDEKKAAYFLAQRNRRVELIEKYCFNEKTGRYCDYDFVHEKKSEIACTACFLPYFYGFARADRDLVGLYDALKNKGGVVACEDVGVTGYQWGYPYIWPPCQYFAYNALKNYGKDAEAKELCENHLRLLEETFERTGALWERYDESGNAADLEYETQEMLGWTAGVYNFFTAQMKK